MRMIRKVTDFYVFSNMHVSLAGFCMTKITLLKFGIHENLTPLFVALSIVVSYNFIRFYEFKTDKLRLLTQWFIKYSKSLIILSSFAVIGLLYILIFTNFNLTSLLILLPFGFMTLFYTIPLFKSKKIEVSFRNFPGIKIFSIAISWAAISVLFPLYEAGFELNKIAMIEFIQRFIILIAITIPFDIRDLKADSEDLKTLPQVLGIKGSKFIGILLLIIFIGLTFLKEVSSSTEIFVNSIIAVITGSFLWFSSAKNSRYFTSFWVEAIPVFWLILIVLFL